MFAIHATYTHTTSDGWSSTRQVPTFYLDERVQGILTEAQAERIARDILTTAVSSTPVNDNLHVHVTAVHL